MRFVLEIKVICMLLNAATLLQILVWADVVC